MSYTYTKSSLLNKTTSCFIYPYKTYRSTYCRRSWKSH